MIDANYIKIYFFFNDKLKAFNFAVYMQTNCHWLAKDTSHRYIYLCVLFIYIPLIWILYLYSYVRCVEGYLMYDVVTISYFYLCVKFDLPCSSHHQKQWTNYSLITRLNHTLQVPFCELNVNNNHKQIIRDDYAHTIYI